MRNYPKLSWKSTTCVRRPSILIDQNRTGGGFNFSPLATDLLSQIVKERARRSAAVNHNTIFKWDGKLYICEGIRRTIQLVWAARSSRPPFSASRRKPLCGPPMIRHEPGLNSKKTGRRDASQRDRDGRDPLNLAYFQRRSPFYTYL